MGKGPEKVKETAYQKELAKTAANEWNRYQDVFVPIENIYKAQTQDMNDDSQYTKTAGNVNQSFNSSYSKAAEQTRLGLSSAGVNPASGKASAAQTELIEDGLGKENQATSAGQHNTTQRFTGNLQNVVAMGKGQEVRSMAGLNDIAAASGRAAENAARNKASELSIPAAAVGLGASVTAANPEWAKSAYSTIKGGFQNMTGGESLGANNIDPFSQMA